jgi:hypothetical protein
VDALRVNRFRMASRGATAVSVHRRRAGSLARRLGRLAGSGLCGLTVIGGLSGCSPATEGSVVLLGGDGSDGIRSVVIACEGTSFNGLELSRRPTGTKEYERVALWKNDDGVEGISEVSLTGEPGGGWSTIETWSGEIEAGYDYSLQAGRLTARGGVYKSADVSEFLGWNAEELQVLGPGELLTPWSASERVSVEEYATEVCAGP